MNPVTYIYFLIALILSMFLAGCGHEAPKNKIYSFIYPTFYLKVIDQSGRPVSGVESTVRHGGNSFVFGSNSGWAKYISDAAGIVAVKVDSRQVSFDDMTKDGYNINLQKVLYEYYKTRSFAVPAQGDLWPMDFNRFSKDSPFVINAWKINQDELATECKNGLARHLLNSNGRSYGVDLLKSGREVIVEGASERDLQIRYHHDNPAAAPNRDFSQTDIANLNWTYSLTASNSGLIEIEPETLYKKTPPESGYVKEWQLSNNTFRGRRSEHGGSSYEDDRHFYLKLDDGTYARLSIRFIPLNKNHENHLGGGIVLDYSVNLKGTRIVRGIDEIDQIRLGPSNKRADCVDFISK